MTISVMITTRNRADDLAVTLKALTRLRPQPDEVLVTLDGCTDLSRQVVETLWPDAKVIENRAGLGSIPARDHMLREAKSDLVLSLDDDSYPLDEDFLARAALFFEQDSSLAVLWFPQRSEEFPASLAQADFGSDQRTGSYPSSGALIRRSTYLALPGYCTAFGHAYEEPDYSLQCIAAGQYVRLHTGLLIRHHYSGTNRNEVRIHHQHSRNECWSVLMRCPWPTLPFVLLRRAAGQFLYACRRGPRWIVREPLWWAQAIRGAPRIMTGRSPLPYDGYRRWRALIRRPAPGESRATSPTPTVAAVD